ncbi:serotonin N-acetyltransferase 1, chloroplastic [Colletotrichum liriopes]|uniref:Serotonin N-acetyltransferase 1, chloroplastic n=1 Tax=Colletotrichum liriopes TaxID=708192 RepID=A0AA37GUQ0_9PEZI|nr:serotonin N-acetyltransferase 1, chloroplastic [Colletotrichum liriopes]
MASFAAELRNRSWVKDAYLVSTDTSLLSIPELNAAFASDSFYWADSLPEPAMQEMLQNSLCFGLYNTLDTTTSTASRAATKKHRFLGFARLVTDYVTFAYVTDVWIDPSTQGQGLGKWLVSCVQETIESMPHLRRSLLFTDSWDKSVPFYEALMKMTLAGGQPGVSPAVMQMKWKGHPDFKDKGS